MNTIADFRSDTVTRPTRGMVEAMISAPLGDDVFGDDPTVNALEARVAAMFGMEASVFCPSGTMTNQIAVKVHTQPGDEIICDRLCHIYNYEGGGIAFNSGCSVRLLEGERGRFTAAMVQEAVNPDDPHFARTSLVAVENTCNKGGGVIWDAARLREISQFCRERGLRFHLDGARLFNALVVTGQDTREVGSMFDSISICMSKGLGCPMGSLLVGSKDFIYHARRVRKVFGGGMRQAGIIAAAANYAFDHHVQRLEEDHKRARFLAERLHKQAWVKHVMPVETNIVVVELEQPARQQEMMKKLEEKGVLATGFGPGRLRFVTHLDIDDKKIEHASGVFDQTL